MEVKGRWEVENNRYLESLLVAATDVGPCASGLYLTSGLPRPKTDRISSVPFLRWDDNKINLYNASFAPTTKDRKLKIFMENLTRAEDLRIAIDEIIIRQHVHYFGSKSNSDAEPLGKAAGFQFDKIRN